MPEAAVDHQRTPHGPSCPRARSSPDAASSSRRRARSRRFPAATAFMTSRSVRIAAIASPSSTTTAPTPRSAIAAAASPSVASAEIVSRLDVMCSETSGIRRFYDSPVESAANPARRAAACAARSRTRCAGRCATSSSATASSAVAGPAPPARSRRDARRPSRRSARRPRFAGSTARTAIDTRGAASAASAARASSGRRPTASGSASQPARSTHRRAFASRRTSTPSRRATGTSSRRRAPARRGDRHDRAPLDLTLLRTRHRRHPRRVPILARLTDLALPAARALRLRRLPARAGGRRARGDRRPRHAGAHADRLGQVAHVSARRDAASRADARPVAADRAHEGPGGQAAAADRGDRDVRQLVAHRGGDGRAARRRLLRGHTPRLRGARSA